MAGYVFLGAGFGILLAKSGYGPLWALLMSITMYAGSMQYVAVSILSAAFDPLATALITLTVNARHLFYGLSMLVPFSTAGKYKPYMIFSLTDETFSLLCQTKAPDGINENKYRFLISLSNHLSWIFGCTAGNILGGFIPPELKGVEFVMTAFFVVIMAEQWLTAKTKLPALAGLAVSVLCLLVFGAESFIIPAMLGILLALVLLKPAILKGGLRLD